MKVGTTLAVIQAQLSSGELTILQIVDHYLENIEKSKHLNAYIDVFAEEARAKAQDLDAKYKENPTSCGKLIGAVISIKDVICYKDHMLSASSKILNGFQSLYSATAVEKLLAEDVIIIGRTNCDEFAMGSGNENSAYGPTINGIGENRVPGGSSGGAAVSVQMDTCVAALGSSTGGSIRQPAAFCGLYGMKPTYGRISRYGLIAYGSSFDQIGVFSRDVDTMSVLMQLMAGRDENDATSAEQPVEEYITEESSDKLKIAYFDEVLNHPSVSKEIKDATLTKIEDLKAAGHTVEPVQFDYLDYLVPTYYILTTAEASSNLGRYDGIRYGHRSKDAKDIHELYIKSRSEGFGPEVKRRIMMGAFVLSVGFYEAYFTKAQKIRKLIQTQIKEIFNTFDLILMPTTPDVAWRINEKSDDPIAEYLADIFTVTANLAGIPAISIPVGTNQNDMPIGIQFMASHFEEKKLLSAVRHFS